MVVGTGTNVELVRHLAQCGPAGTRVDLLPEVLGVSRRTAWRAVGELVAEGDAERHAPGRIRSGEFFGVPPGVLPNVLARDLWMVLDRKQLPAYLSGMDLLAGYAHHFLPDFAHLVVAQTGTGSDIASDLAREGFLVMRAGMLSIDADLTRVVILRELTVWDRYPIIRRLAPPELAWIDLYREVRRKMFQFQPAELGRILSALVADPGSEARLRTMARYHYTEEIESILDGRPEAEFAVAVADGYTR